MTVLPPGRLSTSTGWPHVSFSFCATVRPMMSVLPPAAKGTMSRTAFEGYACAYAASGAESGNTKVTKNTKVRRGMGATCEKWISISIRFSLVTSCLSLFTLEDNQRVGGNHALLAHEERIHVDLRDAVRMVRGEQREPRERVGERCHVQRRPPAVARQHRRALDLSDHLARLVHTERNKPVGHVLHQLGEDAPEPERHDGAE